MRVGSDRVEERRTEFEKSRELLSVEPSRLRSSVSKKLEIRRQETLYNKETLVLVRAREGEKR